MKLSARNQLKSTIKRITPGAVNHEVVIELPGGIDAVRYALTGTWEGFDMGG